MGQLDSVRRELLEVITANSPRVTFGKEIVREVLAFASIGDDEPPRSAAASPAVGPSKGRANKPPSGDPGFPSSLFGLMTSPKQPPPRGPASASIPRTASYNTSYDNDLWDGSSSHRKGASAMAVPGAKERILSKRAPSQSPYQKTPHQIKDEDIYGPAETNKRSPSAGGTGQPKSQASPSSYGGVLRIRDMLARAEEGLSAVAEAQGQRRAVPPRVVNDSDADRPGEGWDELLGAASAGFITPRDGFTTVDTTAQRSAWPASERGEYTPVRDGATPAYEWMGRYQTAASPTPPSVTPYSQTAPKSGLEAKEGGSLGGLVGKLAGLALVLGGIATAAMALTGTLALGGDAVRRGEIKDGQTRKNKRTTPADLPPWKMADGGLQLADRPPRRKASSGRSVRSKSRTGPDGTGQSPVMHVHQPPSSDSFPANPPPDVTAAMG